MSDKRNSMRAKKPKQAPASKSLNPTAQQLAFWQIPEKGFSRTADLYDFVPRFVFGKLGKDDYDKNNIPKPIDRKFSYDNQNYSVYIGVAQLKNEENSGEFVYRLPGKRERIIEDVLRKFAVNGKTYSIDNRLGVIFTEADLYNELKERGHTFKYSEIREALQVLTNTVINLKRIIGPKHEQLLSEPFMTGAAETLEEWKGSGEKTAHLMFFNSQVKESIIKLTYRKYNYELCMSYKNELCVYLHKRLSQNFIQASWDTCYEINLSTLYAGCGLKTQKYLCWDNKKVVMALDEMKEKEVVREWSVKKLDNDYQYKIFAHRKFCNEMKGSNAEQLKLK